MRDFLSIWTIYDHPKDYPDCFVAREYQIVDGLTTATENFMACPTLEVLRGHFIEIGLTCIARSADDDPAIVESWL